MDQNTLYPIFLKTNKLQLLIVGGGYVALEKLTFLLKSSPNTQVEMVATYFREETKQLAHEHQIPMSIGAYEKKWLANKHLVIAATDDLSVNKNVYEDCRSKNILVNVADNPELCDFYMGGIVTKGNVKIAISTNGKSPTTAKRIRQFFEEVIPDQIDDMVQNLNEYRKTIKGDFEFKVEAMNTLTQGLIEKKELK